MFANKTLRKCAWFVGVLALASLMVAVGRSPGRAQSSPWQELNYQAPSGISTMLLLTDGTVMCQGAGTSSNWYRLTPDATGSYVNGTWSQLPSMQVARQYYGSAVLQNGNVFIAGGEYDNSGNSQPADNNTVELFDPLATSNPWTFLPQPIEQGSNPATVWPNIGDAITTVLANGNLIMGSIFDDETAIYDYRTNAWTAGGAKASRPDEESWVLLPGGDIVTVNTVGQTTNGPDSAELYDAATNKWGSDGQTPSGHNVVEASSSEIGPAVLLPSGTVIFVGATGHTALYDASNKVWSGGPDLPKVTDVDSSDQGSNTTNTYNTLVQAQCKDAPGCLEVNGKVLVCAGATGGNYNPKQNGGYPAGQYFFEYTAGSPGSISSVPFPAGSIQLIPPYEGRFLALPSGQVLFANYQKQLYVYSPSSAPNAQWAPTVSNLGINVDATYFINGTQFNGMSQASMYGDDVNVATNYPLVQLSNDNSTYYGRTFGHSTMGVQTGTKSVSTNFTISPLIPSGEYNLAVDANGIASSPIAFHTGVFVNRAWTGPQDGTAVDPFVDVTQGVGAAPGSSDVPSASYIFIQGGSYTDTLTISKPCVLINNGGGTVTIGEQN